MKYPEYIGRLGLPAPLPPNATETDKLKSEINVLMYVSRRKENRAYKRGVLHTLLVVLFTILIILAWN